MNFKGYRTWSRWNKILFLAPVPNIDDLFEVNDKGSMVLSEELDFITPTKLRPFINFFPEDDGLSKNAILMREIRHGLTIDIFRAFRNSLRHGQRYKCGRLIIIVLSTFLEIVSYFFQLLLPLSLLFGLVLVMYQLLAKECKTGGDLFFGMS